MTTPLSQVPFMQTHKMMQLFHEVELNFISSRNENVMHNAGSKPE